MGKYASLANANILADMIARDISTGDLAWTDAQFGEVVGNGFTIHIDGKVFVVKVTEAT